ncbi:pyridoxamine 5'-phosphate oxidase family protein [Defluviimonas sp. SAOS-178_SWC]|uniref:pyridoxamine 5'-phosphate oxidase family protein n=1 Tax=Defluviimonas sp. SAOS-178_SWC TaxID=3121287 RepID=UPI003221581C
MNDRTAFSEDPKAALFAAMDEVRVGMLGTLASGRHMQPMTHFPDPETDAVWFITSTETDLVRSVGLGARAQYCVTGLHHDFHACLAGTIEQSGDRAKLEELWSPVVGAWFDGGIDDPTVSLLRLMPQEAALWTSTDSGVRFGLEVLRANLSADHKPDLGDHVVIRFDAA